MKKSILALCALFIFAGCSVSEDKDGSGVNSDWKALVGGKTIVFEGDMECMFSEDASKLVNKECYTDFGWDAALEIVSSTADSAVYQRDVQEEGLYEYRFKNVKSAGGEVDIYTDGEFAGNGTFTFEN